MNIEDIGNFMTSNEKIHFIAAAKRARDLSKSAAFTRDEIDEILLSEGYSEKVASNALSVVMDKDVKPSVVEHTEAESFPKKYEDIKTKISNVLYQKGPNTFVSLLTSGKNPLVKMSSKDTERLSNIAAKAYTDKIYLEGLHEFIRPSIVTEMAQNVCTARSIKDKCVVSQTQNGYSITHNGKTIVASTAPLFSSSEKFKESNYGIFGIPDEFSMIAYEAQSPYSQLSEKVRKS